MSDSEPLMPESILDLESISGRCFYPQPRTVATPFLIEVDGAILNCYRQNLSPESFTVVHFHGNGEAVADYIPFWSEQFSELGLNSLFIEYRGYGGSTGDPGLVRMLSDGEAALKAAEIPASQTVVSGRSIGSLYAIELASRCPDVAALIIDSGIAVPATRLKLQTRLAENDAMLKTIDAEFSKYFDHQRKLRNYRNPLLTLHTKHDRIVDNKNATLINSWAASLEKRLIEFEHGDHNSIFLANAQQYLAALRELIEKL